MRLLLINPPYRAVTSKYGVGEQIPLGLLSIGGPLIDAGHDVQLIDAEARHLTHGQVVSLVAKHQPDAILTGHSGSTPAHPVILAMTRALKSSFPTVPIVYGGVYPTYHAGEILKSERQIDLIVRGEAEETIGALLNAWESGGPMEQIRGIAYRNGSQVVLTAPAETIGDLNQHRVGWELVEDWDLYQCWGLGRSALIQFSRGCPHLCSYCGQRGYWTRWRYRDPQLVADEIAWLHHQHGINFVDLADENPTSSKRLWRQFLEALIAKRLPVRLFATIRAADIVRDADILHLYKAAGFECFLMGIETTDPKTMKRIRKGSTQFKDYEAIQLLRKHGILSMVGHVVGFQEERDKDYWNALRQLLFYDPDLINAMYVTPHRWTPFYRENSDRIVVQPDQTKWDYRHQVLGTKYMPPWRIFLWVKVTEAVIQLRPSALRRLLAHPDRSIRRALRWCYRGALRTWLDEIHDFVFRSRVWKRGPVLRRFWGEPQDSQEQALALRRTDHPLIGRDRSWLRAADKSTIQERVL